MCARIQGLRVTIIFHNIPDTLFLNQAFLGRMSVFTKSREMNLLALDLGPTQGKRMPKVEKERGLDVWFGVTEIDLFY